MEDKKYYLTIKESLIKEQPFLNNTELAYEMILQSIMLGKWKQGEKIPQKVLAIQFDMSRTPVRDALAKLEQELFIERNEKNGYTVKKIELKDYVDFCEFRMCLEAKASYMAARNASLEQIRELKENLDKLKSISRSDKLYQFYRIDNEFHNLIAKASNNQYIYDTLQKYKTKALFNMNSILNENGMSYVINKHTSIYEALKNNDEEQAEKAMRSHLQFYIKNIYNVYK